MVLGVRRMPVSRLDVSAQLQGAKGIQTVIGERAIGIDRPAQDEADLVGDQAAQPVRPLVLGQPGELGQHGGDACGLVAVGVAECLREGAARGQRDQQRHSGQRQITGVCPVVTQQRPECVAAVLRTDHRHVAAICHSGAAADVGPRAPGDRAGRNTLGCVAMT